MAKSSEIMETDTAKSPPEESIIACPMCGGTVPAGEDLCPKCGEPFTPEAIEKIIKEEYKVNKWLFVLGVVLVLIGGPGVALSSYLHDVLQIQIGEYDSFYSFGWVNITVSVVGIIILVIGIILLILSLPKPKKTEEEDEEIDNSNVTGDQGG